MKMKMNWLLGRKSKTLDSGQCAGCPGCPGSANHYNQCSAFYQPYHQVYPHPQILPQICPYQTHNIIQSPQQSVTCSMQNQMKNNTIDSRLTTDPMFMPNQIQPSQMSMAAYQSNHIQATTDTQSPKYTDNPYYNSNQMAPVYQQQIQNYQIDEQSPKLHKQQFFEQPHYQPFQHHQPQQCVAQPQPQHHQHQHQQQILQQQSIQEQYQNPQTVCESANDSGGDADLSLEVLLIMYEQNKDELTKLAGTLRENLGKISEEWNTIRTEAPVYSVDEVKI